MRYVVDVIFFVWVIDEDPQTTCTDPTICFSGLDFDALIKDIVLPVLGDRKWLTAIVVGDGVQFGVSRQYQVFAGRYSRDSIFSNVDEAEQWIFTQDCPPVLH